MGGGTPEKKSQGSPLWIFWENFQNFKKISNNKKIPRVPPLDILGNFTKIQKISNNGLLLKKKNIIFHTLGGKYGNFNTFFLTLPLNTNKNYQIIWMSKTGSHFFLFNFYPTWSLMDWRPLHVVWLEKQHISCLPSSQWRISECCCHLLVIFCPTDFPYSMLTYIT